MFVRRIDNFEDLHPYQEHWDRLADHHLFRSWTWLSNWWNHYGQSKELTVLLVFDDALNGKQTLVGVLPCYIEQQMTKGRVLRLLGDGEVCSDHLDILVEANNRQRVTSALAKYLVEQDRLWDATYFNAIGDDCAAMIQLGEELEALGCQVSRILNVNRWSIPLPSDWESFLAMQSKSHRKKLRRLDRSDFGSGSVWHQANTVAEFEEAWPILVDLHQRRRESLNEPGCFASQQFSDFHKAVAEELLLHGRLRLSWLEFEGQPVAAEYQFADSHSTFAYQGGLDPEQLKLQPGRLSLMRTIRHSIEEGQTSFDLMRGDEPYKLQWRAEPVATFDIRAVSTSLRSRFRSQTYGCLKSAYGVVRSTMNTLLGS